MNAKRPEKGEKLGPKEQEWFDNQQLKNFRLVLFKALRLSFVTTLVGWYFAAMSPYISPFGWTVSKAALGVAGVLLLYKFFHELRHSTGLRLSFCGGG